MSATRSFRRRLQGRPVLYVEPGMPDELSPAVKNALVARRQANRTGRCPTCGAELEIPEDGPDHMGIIHAYMTHESWCAVGDPLGAA